eukprot:Gregarina_sp_Poly_1__2236@NODE_159_length_12283_cov_147_306729_g141_i0_p8_GENE_NODE_159_length_12283_cov_147_306729_g141_i0NODE_159_length_12283_cov_147_306729_g141_i0_p8_ORF_typecomplete_len205_score38_69Synaptobrevin/PF00957_21/4_1e11Longin/PF13774_6/1e09MCPsignal/PF00015_21/0_025GED/PF02212_18/4_7e03GED/PF02212_18/0_18MRPL52/PF18699_1/0_21_NODE_159_length_12283_cov_147_306729_g141_i011431757
MKLIGLIVCKCYQQEDKPVFLVMTHDVSSFSFVQRNAVKDVSKFLARQIVPKLGVGKREVVSHQEFRFNAMRWSDGLAVCMLTDDDYPPRVAFQCLTVVHNDFKVKVPEPFYKDVKDDGAAGAYKEMLRDIAKQFADPRKFDAVTSTQGKVDDTKEIMQKNLEQVLGNMQQMEELMAQSDDLSANTQQMFKSSKKIKKGCCQVM